MQSSTLNMTKHQDFINVSKYQNGGMPRGWSQALLGGAKQQDKR